MGQVTIYLDEDAERKAREAARAEGISLSRWVAERIQRCAQTEWPAAVREAAGKWTDLASAEDIRGRVGSDIQRERI